MTATETAPHLPRKIGPDLSGAAKARYLVGRGLAAEAAGWRSIGRTLTGRPRVAPGASAHSYDRPIRTVLTVFLGLSIIEVPIIDLIVHRWPAVRFPLLALGLWGVLTMTGMLLNYRSRPHSVGPDGIRVRSGGEVDIDLPWDAVSSVERRRRALPEAPALSLTGFGDDQALNQVMQDGTDIDITLEQPTRILLPQGEVVVSSVRIAVDDTDAFLAAVRTHIP